MINQMQQRLETLLPIANRITGLYYKLPFADPDAGFYSIYSNTQEQAKAYIRKNVPENMEVAGMKLNREKYAQLVDVTGMDEFLDSKEAFRANNGEGVIPFFKIVDKVVKIDEEAFENHAARYTIAVVTEKDRELYDLWKKFVDASQDFSDYMRKRGHIVVNGSQIPNASAWFRLDNHNRLQVNYVTFQAVQKTKLS